LKWWTRSQRIGTYAEIPIDAAILNTGAVPVYQQIAAKAVQLKRLGMSSSAIAKRPGITDKTVAKAVVWHGQMHRYHDAQREAPISASERMQYGTMTVTRVCSPGVALQ